MDELHDPAAADRDPASLYAPHLRDGRFFNPWQPMRVTVADVLRWKLFGRNPWAAAKRRRPVVPRVENGGGDLATPAKGLAATWVGQCTFVVQDGPDVFVTDPHWGARALVPPRLSPPGVPLAAIPPHATVLLSHAHYDHLDAGTVRALRHLLWIAPLGHRAWLRRQGVERVEELDWWQELRLGRFTITCVPAQHWSNRVDLPRNAALWSGWLVDSGERRVYFSGDSGYFHGFAEIGRRFPAIDLALLPIGSWEPRWFMRYQHMNPGDALRAFAELGAAHMAGMHWGTFDLTDEPVDLAPKVLADEFAAGGGDPARVHVLAVGGRFALP